MTFPKIELHVHREGTVRPETLLEIARRNDFELPGDTVEELAQLYDYRDFAHFIEVWILTTFALQTQAARELRGVEVRLTPDIYRGAPRDEAEQVVTYSAKYRERGVVAVGLGGLEAEYPPEPYAPMFERVRAEGLGSVPHAGEVVGPASIRGALDALGAERIRHGIRAVDDPALLEELREREIVLDVCPVSNVRTGAVGSLAEHPLRRLLEAGVRCSISTDDPAMFDTDLTREYETATSLGANPQTAYEAGLAGALCDADTRARLRRTGEEFDWRSLP